MFRGLKVKQEGNRHFGGCPERQKQNQKKEKKQPYEYDRQRCRSNLLGGWWLGGEWHSLFRPPEQTLGTLGSSPTGEVLRRQPLSMENWCVLKRWFPFGCPFRPQTKATLKSLSREQYGPLARKDISEPTYRLSASLL